MFYSVQRLVYSCQVSAETEDGFLTFPLTFYFHLSILEGLQKKKKRSCLFGP